MSSMSSLGVAVSGLRAAQTGLSVTGQNISNSTVSGYTRQQAIQQNFSCKTIGSSAIGSLKMQVGLGTQVGVIRQIRDRFYDINYRSEASTYGFYARKYTAGEEINNIIGELESSYTAQDTITNLWNSINELIQDPSAIETRSLFIQSAITFLNKMQNINENLTEYQLNLNQQIKQEVDDINSIVEQIASLNQKIETIESNGNRANDLRDTRNNLLDQLSTYLNIEIKETPIEGSYATRIDILVEGKELLVNNVQNRLGLKYINSEYPFYEPVFTNSTQILPADADVMKLFSDLSSQDLSVNSSSAAGSLKGLLVSRGSTVGDYTSIKQNSSELNNSLVTQVQAKIDNLVHEIVTLINELATGFDLNGDIGIPIFVRKTVDDKNGIIDPNTGLYIVPEDVDDYSTLFTINNIEINPLLLENDGYNKLGFSSSGDIGDTTILEKISSAWKDVRDNLGGFSIDSYYQKIITEFAVEIKEAQDKLSSATNTLELIENQRISISGVSLDEELSNMIKFQHAYNSAAKVINVLDSMLDKIINNTGRVGL